MKAKSKIKVSKTLQERLPTLDLHAYKSADVPDAVDRFLVQNQKKSKVRIMTGKGTGVVRKATQDYLKLGGFSYYLETLPSGAKNEGVLIVPLDDE